MPIYLIRMYLFGFGMGILDYILNCFTDGDLIDNNIFVNLFCIAVIIRLIEFKLENNSFILLLYFLWLIGVIICYNIDMKKGMVVYTLKKK